MGQLVVWWLVIEGLGLVALPLTFCLFSPSSGHGYVFGKTIALLLLAYVSWLLANAGLPFHVSLLLAGGAFALGNLYLGWMHRAALGDWLRGPGVRLILIHDAFWTFGFLFFAWQRSLGPQIFGAEKYMDFAFFNTLTRTDLMPPQDPWMAGQSINYYYFGYLMLANLTRLAPVANHIAYNLCVVTVAGLAFAEVAAVGLTLTRRLPFACLTGAVAMLIGNLDGFLQLWEKGGFTHFDYWRSSRVVGHGDTINEFPYFTTIHGDLHPHFIVLPVTILLLALLLDPERFGQARRAEAARSWRDLWPYVPVTFVLASMVVISPWELPVGTLVVFLLMGRRLPLRPLVSWARLRLGFAVGAMLVVAYLLYLPFYLHFAAPPGGVGHRFAQTSLVEFLIVFGALLLPAALFLAGELGSKLSITREQGQLVVAGGILVTIIAYLAGNAVFVVLLALGSAAVVCAYATEDSERRGPLLLLVAASIALLACEFVYIKDPYGEKLYRMNTVFKLYFQSWILLAVAAPWCVAQLADREWLPAGTRSAALGG
ncbi:MAG: DUF2298 domain-containing protein, partial [Candidatus Binatia bacterium]